MVVYGIEEVTVLLSLSTTVARHLGLHQGKSGRDFGTEGCSQSEQARADSVATHILIPYASICYLKNQISHSTW